jgi:Flp pilus assembly protein TadG
MYLHRFVPRDRKGQSLVEFALVLPVLLVMVVGLFDFGRAIYASNAISNAARIATRVAIVDQNEDPIKQAAVTEAPGVGLEPSDILVTFSCADSIGRCYATVDVSVAYTPATPMIEAIVGPVTLRASSEMPLERVYVSP